MWSQKLMRDIGKPKDVAVASMRHMLKMSELSTTLSLAMIPMGILRTDTAAPQSSAPIPNACAKKNTAESDNDYEDIDADCRKQTYGVKFEDIPALKVLSLLGAVGVIVGLIRAC